MNEVVERWCADVEAVSRQEIAAYTAAGEAGFGVVRQHIASAQARAASARDLEKRLAAAEGAPR